MQSSASGCDRMEFWSNGCRKAILSFEARSLVHYLSPFLTSVYFNTTQPGDFNFLPANNQFHAVRAQSLCNECLRPLSATLSNGRLNPAQNVSSTSF